MAQFMTLQTKNFAARRSDFFLVDSTFKNSLFQVGESPPSPRLFFRRPFKMMFAERADSPVTFEEFLCATLLLAGVVAAIWLAPRPEDPCLRGSYIIKCYMCYSGTVTCTCSLDFSMTGM